LDSLEGAKHFGYMYSTWCVILFPASARVEDSQEHKFNRSSSVLTSSAVLRCGIMDSAIDLSDVSKALDLANIRFQLM
jgi:hypothetical protein